MHHVVHSIRWHCQCTSCSHCTTYLTDYMISMNFERVDHDYAIISFLHVYKFEQLKIVVLCGIH